MHEPSQRTNFMRVTLASEPPCLFLDLRGELDLCSAKEVPLDGFVSRRDLTTVIVDLGGLTFCDVTGLRTLRALRRIHEAQGRSVVFMGASPFIGRLMRLCGLADRREPALPLVAPV
jgi:anti-sigma B factor antagonist